LLLWNPALCWHCAREVIDLVVLFPFLKSEDDRFSGVWKTGQSYKAGVIWNSKKKRAGTKL